ncbi:MAG: non-homologous end-joining DNA ligase [Prosthecobacter sp.]
MSLTRYRQKRDFTLTPEPAGEGGGKPRSKKKAAGRRFVIQKHDATRLHYDFRLELGGTLVSWAVPKGLPMKHGKKHLAVKVEDHPLSYFDFEGTIPKGQYGGGTVQVWDVGTYEPLSDHPTKELEGGKLHVVLKGRKLSGEWYLVRLRDEDQWLVIRGGEDHKALTKKKDSTSALSGRTLEQIANAKAGAVWNSKEKDEDGGLKKKVAKKAAARKKKEPPRLTKDDVTFIEPMKARTVEDPPPGDWLYEVKLDGFRAMAYKEGQRVCLLSRTNNELTDKFPEVAAAMRRFGARRAIVDGEIVALDAEGRSSFQALQAYDLGQEKPPICFYVFDLVELQGKSLRQKTLEQRKAALKPLLPEGDNVIRWSPSLEGEAEMLLDMARKHGFEGLIGKKAASRYEAGQRSGSWIKLKVVAQQEFVIGGYTPPGGSRPYFGALLVGVYDKGKLRYAGKVGTGFDHELLKTLHARFKKIARKTCPFSDLPEERERRYGQAITASVMKQCHWVRPELVAQLKFQEWTRDGRLRQPVFMGLREDKAAEKVVRELDPN